MPEPFQQCGFFKHETAIVDSTSIGLGTRIWAFAHVLGGAKIGADCNICDHTFIENEVHVGDRVTIKCGVQLWDGITIDDDVFIGPNVTFTNDPFPRSKQHLSKVERTFVGRGASIGANATILPGISIGEKAMVGAGAVVTRNVPPLAIVAGNPARIVGYVGTNTAEPLRFAAPPAEVGAIRTTVGGVTLHRLAFVQDLRGMLTAGEVGAHVPFEVKRYFLVFGVSSKEIRGEHAHKSLHQFLVCAHGSCRVVADDGENRQEFCLDHPTVGVYLPPLVWAAQYKYTEDAVLLVLASEPYDASDYIRDYSRFLKLAASSR